MTPRLSVLDTTPVGPGVSHRQALAWTAQVAEEADALGCHRFWVAEHHAIGNGCGVPAVLIAHLATITTRVRLGAGGVMLPNRTPLIVAEEFLALEALDPGRIDLGVGRGTGADVELLPLLRRNAADDAAYARSIDQLVGLLQGAEPPSRAAASPGTPPTSARPALHLLGASVSSALLAAARGLPLALAHHQAPAITADAVRAYRDAFIPHRPGAAPYVMASVRAVGRETDDEAEVAATYAAAVTARRSAAVAHGLAIYPDVLGDTNLDDVERGIARDMLAQGEVLVGGPARIDAALRDLVARLGVDEVMIEPFGHEGPGRAATVRAAIRGRVSVHRPPADSTPRRDPHVRLDHVTGRVHTT